MERGVTSSLLSRVVQLPNAMSTELPFDHSKSVSVNRNCAASGLTLPLRAGDPNGWFHCFPHFRPSFISGEKTVLERPEPVQASTARCHPKHFLVFDQSGDKTTLIYSPMTGGSPVCINSNLKCNISDKAKTEIQSETRNLSGPNLSHELNAKSSEDEEWSDLREDTEEINALLYSDDESNDDEDYDDEETSTGHSPSIMITEKDLEEVASSGGCAKRRKISQDEYDARSLMDTASSARTSRSFQVEDDAESKLADTQSLINSRRERIRETVEILQGIVPGAKGRGSIAILEESIRYLRSLKDNAERSGFVGLGI